MVKSKLQKLIEEKNQIKSSKLEKEVVASLLDKVKVVIGDPGADGRDGEKRGVPCAVKPLSATYASARSRRPTTGWWPLSAPAMKASSFSLPSPASSATASTRSTKTSAARNARTSASPPGSTN